MVADRGIHHDRKSGRSSKNTERGRRSAFRGPQHRPGAGRPGRRACADPPSKRAVSRARAVPSSCPERRGQHPGRVRGARHPACERTRAAPAWRCAPRGSERGGVAQDVEAFLASDGNGPNGAPAEPQTRAFWGSFSFDNDLAARVLQPLPPVILLRDLAHAPIEWLDLVCTLILQENQAGRPGAAVMVSRLLDLLLIQILRRWAQSAEVLPGWLAAAKDERIARAVSAIHGNPAQDWSNERLAALSGMSKSSFVERFGQLLGHRPGTYLRHWRLDRAAEALQHSTATIDAIAASVGYSSQEAFSRAFQSRFGASPSAWRAARSR